MDPEVLKSLIAEALATRDAALIERIEAMGGANAELMKQMMDHVTAPDTDPEDVQITASGMIAMIRQHAQQAGRKADMTDGETAMYAAGLLDPALEPELTAFREQAEKLAAAGVAGVDELLAEHAQVVEALEAADAAAQAERRERVKAAIGIELADEALDAMAVSLSDADLEKLEARAAPPAPPAPPADPDAPAAAPEGEDEGVLSAGGGDAEQSGGAGPIPDNAMGGLLKQLRAKGVTGAKLYEIASRQVAEARSQ